MTIDDQAGHCYAQGMPMPQEVVSFLNANSESSARQRDRRALRDFIENSSFEVAAYHRDALSNRSHGSHESYGLFLKPSKVAQQQFRVDREVLLWRTTYPSFQARDLQAAMECLKQKSQRLSGHIWILLSEYRHSDINQMEILGDTGPTLVHLTISDVERDGFDACLRRQLARHNFFDVSGAAVRSSDFFGRAEILNDTIQSVARGGCHLGFFGLRKIGKTSLLNRLEQRLRDTTSIAISRLDLQWIVSVEESVEYLLWSLGASLYEKNSRVRRVRGLLLMGQSWDQAQEDRITIKARFANDLGKLLDAKINICILLDEVERIYRINNGMLWINFWRLIRGIEQQYPGLTSILVFGTDHQCIRDSHLDGEDNPAFDYLIPRYLTPLGIADSRELIVALSGLMGRRFAETAVQRLHHLTGGHPALLRKAGSSIMDSLREREWDSMVEERDLDLLAAKFRSVSEPIVTQIISVLKRQKDAFQLFRLLALREIGEYESFADLYPTDALELFNLGVVQLDGIPRITIALLAEYVLRDSKNSVPAINTLPINIVGSRFGEWTVKERVARGGFSQVYRGVSAGGDAVAMKILTADGLRYLQREVDALREFNHPNIVGFRELIYLDDNRPCIIMEYVPGVPMSRLCSQASRPTATRIILLLEQCLEALAYLHDGEFLERGDTDLGPRGGYIHRDIKPENILVCGDRAVLIDFNIVSRAGDEALTVSATPGYGIYPIPGHWGPSTDLGALGMTFCELAAGGRFSEFTGTDMDRVITSCVGANLARLLIQLRDRHMASARIALKELRSHCDPPVG